MDGFKRDAFHCCFIAGFPNGPSNYQKGVLPKNEGVERGGKVREGKFFQPNVRVVIGEEGMLEVRPTVKPNRTNNWAVMEDMEVGFLGGTAEGARGIREDVSFCEKVSGGKTVVAG